MGKIDEFLQTAALQVTNRESLTTCQAVWDYTVDARNPAPSWYGEYQQVVFSPDLWTINSFFGFYMGFYYDYRDLCNTPGNHPQQINPTFGWFENQLRWMLNHVSVRSVMWKHHRRRGSWDIQATKATDVVDMMRILILSTTNIGPTMFEVAWSTHYQCFCVYCFHACSVLIHFLIYSRILSESFTLANKNTME